MGGMSREDEAMAVALEHYRWCRSQGHSLVQIAGTLDVRLAAYEGEDDVLRYIALRWLQIIPGSHRTQQQRAKRAA